ncbi:MAG: hypothetical protein C5B55_09300 [Blastocatellia bacterium]|nr:MAG: hypothetical protein C5B55_09300 [Blastocatellia bacterium]
MAGQVLGTPYYMSPEQWGEIPRDGNIEIDGRADIYSLGLVFYELIAGRRCYSGATLHELRRDHITTSPKPLAEVVPGVPQAFSDAIQRATAKDRADRQSTAAQLESELKASLHSAVSTFPIAGADSLAATIAAPVNVPTNADVTAATIVENPVQTSGGSAATSPPPGAAASAPPIVQPPPSQPFIPTPAPSVAESKTIASVLTVPRAEPRVGTPTKKSKAGLIVGVAALLLLLLVGGGIAAVFFLKSRQSTSTAATGGSTTTNTASTTPHEVARYWLELDPKSGNKPARVAGLVPLASGQSFRMHFVFPEDGYLYLIGPGPDGNKPTAFLTSKSSPETGLDSNQAGSGVDLGFPGGTTNWLTLDRNPGTEYYTVIFSKTQLSSENFLNVPVNGEALSSSQRDEMNQFIAKYQTQKPSSELDESDTNAPFVRVKATNSADKPVIFDIKIQHN